MKLSDVGSSKYLKLLAYGDSGAGKTVFAAGCPHPMLYLDFDGKVNSAANFYAKDTERLAGIEVVNLKPILGQDPIVRFSEEMRKLEKANPYKTVVLDSITTFSAAALLHIVKTNHGIKRVETAQGKQPGMQDYGILKREFSRLIPGLLSLDCNVLMLAHIKTEKDEVSGEIVRGTMMDGSFAQELPIYFDEVWHCFVKDVNGKRTHMAQTQSDYKFKCRSQIVGLPKEIELSYSTVNKYLGGIA